MDRLKGCLWKSILVCRGVTREYCVNTSHDGDVFMACIVNDMVKS